MELFGSIKHLHIYGKEKSRMPFESAYPRFALLLIPGRFLYKNHFTTQNVELLNKVKSFMLLVKKKITFPI